jgi:hypothetical protein
MKPTTNIKLMTLKESDDTSRDVFEYLRLCEVTGKVFWKKRPSKWSARRAGDEAGTRHGQGYRMLQLFGKLYLSHRIVWLLKHGAWPDGIIDHINGVEDDNRPENLREVTFRQNLRNTSRHRNGKYCGVFEARPGRWMAAIRVGGKLYHLGTYDTPEEAAAIYASVADNPDKMSLINKIRSTMPRIGGRP